MIQPYPPSPRPVFTRICCTFMINFSTLYISYIFQLKFKLSWPLCIFLTHKNTKSHIIKTHNCCESIKRELKQKKQFLEVHWQMYCTSVFFFLFFFNFTTRWWVHRVPSSIECVGWLDGSKAEAQPDKVYKINPPSSCVLFKGEKMWGRKNKPKKKKKSHRKKKKYCSSWNPFFSAGFFFFFAKSHLKGKKKKSFFSLFFSSSSLKTEQAVDYTLTPAIGCVLRGCPVKW